MYQSTDFVNAVLPFILRVIPMNSLQRLKLTAHLWTMDKQPSALIPGNTPSHAQTPINAVHVCCTLHFLNLCIVTCVTCLFCCTTPLLLVLAELQATHIASDRCPLLACAPGLPTSSLDCLLTQAFLFLASPFCRPLHSLCAAWTWNDVRCARSSSHPTTTRASSKSTWRATGKSAQCAVSSSRWTATRRCLRTTCSLTLTATHSTSTRGTEKISTSALPTSRQPLK